MDIKQEKLVQVILIKNHIKKIIMKKTIVKCCGKVWKLWTRKDKYPDRKHEDGEPLPQDRSGDNDGGRSRG